VTVLAGDALGHGHALLLGLVRQHRAADDVADGPHVGEVRAALGVHRDEAAGVEREAHGLGVEARRMRDASRSRRSGGRTGRTAPCGGVGVVDGDVLGRDGDLADLHAEL
jgi:hypothetical protein